MIARLFALLAALALWPAAAPAQDKSAARDEAAETLSAIVRVKAKILPNARSSATLGPQREGSGALVREGYVATIGYLVIESESIEVTGADGAKRWKLVFTGKQTVYSYVKYFALRPNDDEYLGFPQ